VREVEMKQRRIGFKGKMHFPLRDPYIHKHTYYIERAGRDRAIN